MRFFLTMLLLFNAHYLFAQKLVIDSMAYRAWPSLGAPLISNNGRFIIFDLQNIPMGGRTSVLQSTDGKWKKEFKGGILEGSAKFKGKYVWFLRNDSLVRLALGTDDIKYISGVSSFWFQKSNEVEYLIYRLKNNERTLVITDLKSQNERRLANIDSWSFKEGLLVVFKSKVNNDNQQSMNLVNINTGKLSEIWTGNRPENLILDAIHYQLAFKIGDSVWHFKIGSSKPKCILHKNSVGIEKGLGLGYLDSFSKDGKFLVTSLVEKVDKQIEKGVVDIWSYLDLELRTEQEKRLDNQKYLAEIDILGCKVIKLQELATEQYQFPSAQDAVDTIALIEDSQLAEPWSIRYKCNWSLMFMKSGKRKTLDFLNGIRNVTLSPNGKYLIYFDSVRKDFFSYEILTQTIRNLTKNVVTSWTGMQQDDLVENFVGPRGIASWFKNDRFVLIYDRYDIWRLDPLNMEGPVNLTNGFGKRNQIIFSLIFNEIDGHVFNKDNKIYLTALNVNNKDNGFYCMQLKSRVDPKFLYMGPYIFRTNSTYIPGGLDFMPIKAEQAESYIVRRMSVNNFPNYYSTKDFKRFVKLSNLQPEKKYNWYTSELHSWESLDGRRLKGILYKPENFDPSKKYPVIFYYYERKSDGLNAYLTPEVLGEGAATINIPSYVSQGYLIFMPDIYYNIGDPMQGTYDAVVSAASYLARLPFINRQKMGIQGNSFGGFQTNYLVSHTDIFAAAVSCNSVSDLVSAYGSLMEDGSCQQSFYETGQIRMGGSLWEKPESYIKSSSIFQVNKITTPLLIMHTKKDAICPYQNIIEFFTGLRRMGKRAWMLAYSRGNHGVFGNEADDFSIRMMQFFDHYLKDKPAPIWMTRGNNAFGNSIDGDYNYDLKIKMPEQGLLIPSEKTKADSLMRRKQITIVLR